MRLFGKLALSVLLAANVARAQSTSNDAPAKADAFQTHRDAGRVQPFKRDQFFTVVYASAAATDAGGELSSAAGNFSTHFTTSPGSPF